MPISSPFFRQTSTTPGVRVRQVGPSYPGRPQYTGTWVPGMQTRQTIYRHYDYARFSPWASVSTLPDGRWARGRVLRFPAPAFTPTLLGLYSHDPTVVADGG